MPGKSVNILILGGTREARALASRLEGEARFHVVTSLAGRTRRPNPIAGEVRVGGFGGVQGLRDYIVSAHIALIADATHPFAAQISAHAVQASAGTGVPCYRLERSPWEPQPGDDWSLVATAGAAARAIPKDARALVTVGRQDVASFLARADITVVARMIEPPDIEVPAHGEIILARPPFSIEQERALMGEKRIDVLVTRNSGGEATYAKIQAARELGLPVIMIARPDNPPLAAAASVDEMMLLIEQSFA